jgi:hypothetical protein
METTWLGQQRRDLSRWLRAFAHWLYEAHTFWLGAGVLVITVVLAFVLGESEQALRILGLLLQLLGIATVMVGIRTTRRQFGHRSLAATSLAWFRRFPRCRPPPIDLGGGLSTAGVEAMGSGQVRAGRVDDSAEAWLNALQKDMDGAYTYLGRLEADLNAAISQHKGAVDQEARDREAGDRALRSMLESTQTGGLSLSTVGATWLFVGVILATVAPELSGVLT